MKQKRHYRAEVTARKRDSSETEVFIDLGNKTYLDALNKAHELCRLTLDPSEKYKIRIVRDDGHAYRETVWYRFTGKFSYPSRA